MCLPCNHCYEYYYCAVYECDYTSECLAFFGGELAA